MVEFLIVLVIVIGFVVTQYFTFKHIAKLEILLKADSLYEAKRYEDQPREEIIEREQSLSDLVLEKTPEEIQAAFRTPVQDSPQT